MRPIHHRMPLILQEADWKFWLTIDPGKTDELTRILKPKTDDLLQTWPVSRDVNSVFCDKPENLKQIWDDKGGQLNLFG